MVECFGHLVSPPLLNLEEFVNQIDGCGGKGELDESNEDLQ